MLTLLTLLSLQATTTRFVDCTPEFQSAFSSLVVLETAGSAFNGLAVDCRARAVVVRAGNNVTEQTWPALAECHQACNDEARVAALLASELLRSEGEMTKRKMEAPRDLTLQVPVLQQPPWAKPIKGVTIAGISLGSTALGVSAVLITMGAIYNGGLGYQPNAINGGLYRGNDSFLAGIILAPVAVGLLVSGIIGYKIVKNAKTRTEVTLTVTPGGLAAMGSF